MFPCSRSIVGAKITAFRILFEGGLQLPFLDILTALGYTEPYAYGRIFSLATSIFWLFIR